MQLFLSVAISGIAVGSLYGLLGFAIAVVYKSTGVINFAQGSLATFCTFFVWSAIAEGFGVWVGIVLALPLAGLTGVLIYYVVIRPWAGRVDSTNVTYRTLGLYIALLAVVGVFWGEGQPFAFPSPVSGSRISMVGISISVLDFARLGVAAALAAALHIFFKYTKTGLLYRAAAQAPDVVIILGGNMRRLSVSAWAAVSVLALIVGVLTAPTTYLTTHMMDAFLLFAFSAAVIAGMDSLLGVLVCGLGIGVLANLLNAYVGADMAVVVVFVALIAMLVIKPSGLFARQTVERL